MSSNLSRRTPSKAFNNPWEAPVVSKWRENPERMAWIVILTSFAVFCLLAIVVPFTITYVIRYAT